MTPEEVKTKFVKIGKKQFEIPADMEIAFIVSKWQRDSETLDRLLDYIMENEPGILGAILFDLQRRRNEGLPMPNRPRMTGFFIHADKEDSR